MKRPDSATASALFHCIPDLFAASVGSRATPQPVTLSETDREIARRYGAGESLAIISQVLGLTLAVVRRILKRMAVPLRPKYPVTGPHEHTILGNARRRQGHQGDQRPAGNE